MNIRKAAGRYIFLVVDGDKLIKQFSGIAPAFKFVQDHRHKLSQQNNEQSTLEKREFFNRGVKKWRTKYKLTL